IVGLILILYFLADLSRMVLTIHDLQRVEERLTRDIKGLEAEIEKLKAQLTKLQTREGVEEAIRNILGWLLPGDKSVGVVEGSQEPGPPSGGQPSGRSP
ncbi:MAG: septum formation initiator family protein, partial [Anaerolineae bacterium]